MPTIRASLAALAAALVLATSVPASAAVLGTAWILVDDKTGSVMASSNPDLALPPASLTKMVTAQVVAERARMDATILISRKVARAEADRVRWPEGMRFTVEDVLHGLLLESSNGAGIALAEHVAGSEGAFARLMNDKARSLGATSARFVNPHGLDAPGQVASPRDMAAIARGLLRVPALAAIVRKHSYKVQWLGGLTTFHNNTRFLSAFPGAVGVKPGYTTNAGNCLAAAAVRGGRTLVAVVMNSTQVTEDAAALMRSGFQALGIPEAAARQAEGDDPEPVEPVEPVEGPPLVAVEAGSWAPPAEEARVAAPPDSRVPSPAGTALVMLVAGFVSVRRRKARAPARSRARVGARTGARRAP